MKKLTLAILLFALLLSVFVSCNTEKGGDNGENAVGDDLPADLRFNGEKFTIATYEGGNVGKGWACFFDVDEPEEGNALQKAAYDRNKEVEERLGVTISCEEPWVWDGTGEGLMYVYQACSLVNKELYQSYFMESLNSYEVLIADEMILNVAEMPYMDLNKPYYNKKANDVYNIGGRLYFFVSDITYSCQSAAMWLVNNEMLTELGYEETYLYDKVNDGTWTLDVVFEMIEGVRSDLNGDGIYDYNDRWGFSGQPYAPCYLYPAAGLRGAYIGENGFEFDYGTDYAIEVVDRILDLVEHEDTWFDYSEGWLNSFVSFWNGNSLFMGYASEIRALEQITFDFGVLPYPKYRETQETYQCDAGGGFITIPCNIENADMVGAVLEAMASGSAKHFVPAFYGDYIERGVLRDDYSRENWAKMLNEWGIYELTRGISPNDRLIQYKPAYWTIGEASRDFVTVWSEQKDHLTDICQDFYDLYLS